MRLRSRAPKRRLRVRDSNCVMQSHLLSMDLQSVEMNGNCLHTQTGPGEAGSCHEGPRGSYKCPIGLALLANKALPVDEICKYIRREHPACVASDQDLWSCVQDCLCTSGLFQRATQCNYEVLKETDVGSSWEIVPERKEELTREVLTFIKTSGTREELGGIHHLPSRSAPPSLGQVMCDTTEPNTSEKTSATTEDCSESLPPLLAVLLQRPPGQYSAPPTPTSATHQQTAPGTPNGNFATTQPMTVQAPTVPQIPSRVRPGNSTQQNLQQNCHQLYPLPQPLPFPPPPSPWHLTHLQNTLQQANVFHQMHGQPLLPAPQFGLVPNGFQLFPDNYINQAMWQDPSHVLGPPGYTTAGFPHPGIQNWNRMNTATNYDSPQRPPIPMVTNNSAQQPFSHGTLGHQQQPTFPVGPCNPQVQPECGIATSSLVQPPMIPNLNYPPSFISNRHIPPMQEVYKGPAGGVPHYPPYIPSVTPVKHGNFATGRREQHSTNSPKTNDTAQHNNQAAKPSPMKYQSPAKQREVSRLSSSDRPLLVAVFEENCPQVKPEGMLRTYKERYLENRSVPPRFRQSGSAKEQAQHNTNGSKACSEGLKANGDPKLSTSMKTTVTGSTVSGKSQGETVHQSTRNEPNVRLMSVPTTKCKNLKETSDELEGAGNVTDHAREAYSKWIGMCLRTEEGEKSIEPVHDDDIEHTLGGFLTAELREDTEVPQEKGEAIQNHNNDADKNAELSIREVLLAVSTVHVFVTAATTSKELIDTLEKDPATFLQSCLNGDSITGTVPHGLRALVERNCRAVHPSVPPGFETQSEAKGNGKANGDHCECEALSLADIWAARRSPCGNDPVSESLLATIRKNLAAIIPPDAPLPTPFHKKQTLTGSLEETFTDFAPLYVDLVTLTRPRSDSSPLLLRSPGGGIDWL